MSSTVLMKWLCPTMMFPSEGTSSRIACRSMIQCSARIPACRVHNRVNALNVFAEVRTRHARVRALQFALTTMNKSTKGYALGIWIAAISGMLFCTILYKYTLRAWFQAADFAWLGLRLHVHNAQQFWYAMFAPLAGGSIRPFSERAFFMGFSWLFGIHASAARVAGYVKIGRASCRE